MDKVPRASQGSGMDTVVTRVFEHRMAADPAGLPGLLAAVEDFAAAAALPPRLASRLLLVVEELAVNTVTHGTATAQPATQFRLGLEAGPQGLQLRAEDDGEAHDPSRTAVPNATLSLDDREPGGLGLHLVRELTSGLVYQRHDGHNQVTCKVRPD